MADTEQEKPKLVEPMRSNITHNGFVTLQKIKFYFKINFKYYKGKSIIITKLNF